MLSVVSIWNSFTPDSAMNLPMRQFELCSSEWCMSMNDRLCSIVRTLWWCLMLR